MQATRVVCLHSLINLLRSLRSDMQASQISSEKEESGRVKEDLFSKFFRTSLAFILSKVLPPLLNAKDGVLDSCSP